MIFRNRIVLSGLALLLASCSTKLSSFEVIGGNTPSAYRVARSETGVQGGSIATDNTATSVKLVNGKLAGYTLGKVTIGGSYLRRDDLINPHGISAVSGALGIHPPH